MTKTDRAVPEPAPERVAPWSPPTEAPAAAREPILRAPPAVLSLVVVTLVAYALQRTAGDETVVERFGFSSAGLVRGHWAGLFTALFVHGNWPHVLMNTLGALAFGAPVARLFGARPRGMLLFYGFYLVCGALSSLGYAAVHPNSPNLLVGASGAVSGLMGAASRLIERRRTPSGRLELSPFESAPVLGMAAAWTVVNLLIAFARLGVGTGTAPVAWEAHLFGYAAGLFLVGPATWFGGARGQGAPP